MDAMVKCLVKFDTSSGSKNREVLLPKALAEVGRYVRIDGDYGWRVARVYN